MFYYKRSVVIELERIKVAFIGAGSAAWSSKIVVDLLIKSSLKNSVDIWLMDISARRLELIYSFTKRYIEELGVGARAHKTMSRVEAVRDADFVINSAMYGGHEYYELMRSISEKHGYYRGINSVEWNYVSDYPTIWGYYQFKLALEIARDVEEYARDAWLVNVANPVFELSTLITRKTRVKYIGLCHGHLGYLHSAVLVLAMRLAKEKLGVDVTRSCAAGDIECYSTLVKVVDFSELDVEMAGFNHVIWLTKFKYRGEDAYKYLEEWIREDAEKYWETWRTTTHNPFDIELSPAAIDMYRTYGLLPIGDTVRGGTWKYHWDLKTKQYWYGPYGGPDSEIGWAMYTAGLKSRLARIELDVFNSDTRLTQRYPPVPSGESLVEIIEALVLGDSRDHYYLQLPVPGVPPVPVPIQVNIPNRGAVYGIPDDVVVEVPGAVTRGGVVSKTSTSLPAKILKYVMLYRLMRAEWAIEAFLSGGRDHLFNWLIVDPRTKSNEQVEAVIDTILRIPGNEEMAKHYS